MLHGLDAPGHTIARIRHFDFEVEKTEKELKEYFDWDSVLKDVFKKIIGRYKEIKKVDKTSK